MPLVYVTGPTSAGKDYEVRVGDVIYQVIVNGAPGGADLYVPPEHFAAFQSAVATQGDTAHARPE